MIPTFPNFKLLEWKDYQEVEPFIFRFPPYSDFNFTSLWSWNTHERIKLSQLNNNLVVLFTDYLTNNDFLSFIGDCDIVGTAEVLLKWSEGNIRSTCLKLLPEHVIDRLNSKELIAIPDEDAHDYILSVPFLASLNEQRKSKIANNIRRFLKDYPNNYVAESWLEEIDKQLYFDLFYEWAGNCNTVDTEKSNEFRAFKRHLQIADGRIKVFSLFVDDTLVAFDTIEFIKREYATVHFGKTNNKYKGVFEYFQWREGQYLLDNGIRYLNIEQDLGIPGLRFSKRKFKPCFFLKKFKISHAKYGNYQMVDT